MSSTAALKSKYHVAVKPGSDWSRVSVRPGMLLTFFSLYLRSWGCQKQHPTQSRLP